MQRGGPDHVKIRHEIHETLSIHRHKIVDLSHGPVLAGTVAQTKSLQSREREGMGVNIL